MNDEAFEFSLNGCRLTGWRGFAALTLLLVVPWVAGIWAIGGQIARLIP